MLFTFPAPDPAPHSGSAPITYVGYDYAVSDRSRHTHKIIPGRYFLCHMSATGKRHCRLMKGTLPAR